ncbi:MAG: molybdopterin-dependent oxidoreductase [Bryobacteraceae bacterium]|nr:molybdopterin-dependent oxidoreductase [Bryobacteraceae bacterium]
MIRQSIRDSSLAALVGLVVSYGAFYALGWPLPTEAIAEWIMAETPSAWAVPILDVLGDWAKPWAITGGLAALGFALWIPAFLARRGWPVWCFALVPGLALLYAFRFDFWSWPGNLAFWLPSAAALIAFVRIQPRAVSSQRREFLISASMLSGTVGVAAESYVRNRSIAASAVTPVDLFPMVMPPNPLPKGLVRKPITPVGQFYVMSKNSVDPALDPRRWRLRIKREGRLIRDFSYNELLGLPRRERYQTLRCISNTLKTDLMGTAYWSGVRLDQLCDRRDAGDGAVEAVVLGVDGHGDSFPVSYAFEDEFMLALGMNGQTLNRNHGFPIRLLVPRYYGFKNIKWIGEIDFVTKPYFGTWPKRGFSKDAFVHTMSHIDRIAREGEQLRLGGVAFAGVRGIERVEARVDQGPWAPMSLEPALSIYTWTRWQGTVAATANAQLVEVRAQDGQGRWQLPQEKPQFPDGVAGPTIRRIPT